jgi:hypothetical protein
MTAERDRQHAGPSPTPIEMREHHLLRERVEAPTMADPTYRVTFERDDGQQYGVGARVSVHAMDSQFRTLDVNPASGRYRVMRCDRIRATGWKALRVSLHLVDQPRVDALLAPPMADDRR